MKEFAPFGSKFFPLREVHENEGPKIVLGHSSKDNIVEQGTLEKFFFKIIIMFEERRINGKERKIHPLGGPHCCRSCWCM